MKILMATDGSKFSLRAARKCGEIIAGGPNTTIRIISVVEPFMPLATEPFVTSHEYYTIVEEDLKRKARQAVGEAEKIVREAFDGTVGIQTDVVTGNVKQTLVEEAREFGADLIVVGSHGYGFLERVLLGSVSSFVIHHAPCSVLIVRMTDDGVTGPAT